MGRAIGHGHDEMFFPLEATKDKRLAESMSEWFAADVRKLAMVRTIFGHDCVRPTLRP